MRTEAKSFRLRAVSDAEGARRLTRALSVEDDDLTVPVVLDRSVDISQDDARAPTASFALDGEVVAPAGSPFADYAELLARLTGRAFRRAASTDDATSGAGDDPTTVVLPSALVTPELLPVCPPTGRCRSSPPGTRRR